MIPVLARIGEYGFTHKVNTGIDVSGDFVSCTFQYKDPGGVVTDKTCDDNTTASGIFGWSVTSGFFDEEGVWELQIAVDRGASGVRRLKHPIVFRIGASGE